MTARALQPSRKPDTHKSVRVFVPVILVFADDGGQPKPPHIEELLEARLVDRLRVLEALAADARVSVPLIDPRDDDGNGASVRHLRSKVDDGAGAEGCNDLAAPHLTHFLRH
jgi:hypothetical protein